MDIYNDVFLKLIEEAIFEEELKKEMLIRVIISQKRFVQELSVDREISMLLRYSSWEVEDLEKLNEAMEFEVQRKHNNRMILGRKIYLN